MAVRYRPRGFQIRPGDRVSYWFENSVTEAKGLAPSHSTALVHRIGHGFRGFTEVDVTFESTGHRTTAPMALFGPLGETIEEARTAGRGYPEGYFGKHDFRPRYERKYEAWQRAHAAHPISPDLLERAIERFGPRDGWGRAQRQRQAAHERWLKRYHPDAYQQFYGTQKA